MIAGRGFLKQIGANVQPIPASLNFGLDANDNGIFDDVDDYDGTQIGLVIYANNDGEQTTTTSQGDYVDKNLTMTTDIAYINDTPATFAATSRSNNLRVAYNNPSAQSTNIKFVHLQLGSNNPALQGTPELNKSIILDAFSCNLGVSVFGEAQKW